jgi:hypothetical protein
MLIILVFSVLLSRISFILLKMKSPSIERTEIITDDGLQASLSHLSRLFKQGHIYYNFLVMEENPWPPFSLLQ